MQRDSTKQRFAIIGTGGRARMFLDPVATQYRDEAELVGLCDSSVHRVRYQRDRLRNDFGYPEVPVFRADEFEKMLQETRPDKVIICTIDSTHDQYIVKALSAGFDVITEKPMTIDAQRCRNIFAAVKDSGRKLQVAFNCRWSMGASKVRELMESDTIGKVRQVNMEYLLNTRHGADYFRRWHAEKKNSGGLLVHKSTHHFDLVNWWLNAIPEEVFARGQLSFYGKKNAVERGDVALTRYPRYRGYVTAGDPFAYEFDRPMLEDCAYENELYVNAEVESGYIRDLNVFREGIDAEDVMNVVVRYRTGELLNYSLNAFSPYEGFRVTFAGDRGRIEYQEAMGAHIVHQGNVEELPNDIRSDLRVFPLFRDSYHIPIDRAEGGHGGSDPRLQEQIFSRQPPIDPYCRFAGHEQGAASIMIGIAANESIKDGGPHLISRMIALPSSARFLSELV